MGGLQRIGSVLIAAALLAGCGYRPTSRAVKPVLQESVSTKIVISMQDPDNTVYIKDALDEAVVNRFRTRLTDEAHASTHLVISLRKVVFNPVQYDTNGYIVAYRAIVTLDIDREHGEQTRRYNARGSYLFTIEPNAIISDLVRFEAIKYGSEKALDSFVAQVAGEGASAEVR
ncbi:hypothetical protein ACM66T_02640 [Sulfurimonas sp. ST-25]|uniref:hypothetical protein n=1 Tax=Sulfurimonas sp. ST-25 TaxID=3400151 RepID=UPI003A8C4454